MSSDEPAPQIVWLRRDLRLADQPALYAAGQAGPVIPVYVLDDERPGNRAFGGAHRWWLHHSLDSLGTAFAAAGSKLVLRRGDAVQVLVGIAQETGATAIHAIRHYEPWWRDAEEELAEALHDIGAGAEEPVCRFCLHDGNYLLPPGTAQTGSGNPYKIYTPFSKAVLDQFPPRDALPQPGSIGAPEKWPESDALADWKLLPTKPDWAQDMAGFWQIGEAAAHDRLKCFEDDVARYDDRRNLPSEDGSSRLSPHLHWGEISPVQVWHELKGRRGNGWATFEKELLWRDFAQNLIYQFPSYSEESYRDSFDRSLWRNPNRGHMIEAELEAWKRGQTGYPIVDAGMRQLWALGWMHNRVRMITASFLIKHLLIDWRHGERWFWDTLVDGDYASNGCNWQWVAGTGVDSNMFPRIMAPLSQSEKFDAGNYIREWVPELAGLPDDQIHDPDDEHRPDEYPAKLIGHREARERALQAYREMKED
ncbi:deoxyribodipyrimidine photo-lyase [Altererythrobacter sp. SALINAS58]|uniref:cryptochrome/photolyase family protein n=1 Tax=Alteripontixanthobacter muriae TaxID=2705546 RepID=UPI0015769688|nr:deoxyribodipyrimidine photo-lyase [Alteripontixanthobacter muriae]NTZ43074.1 deoxyribodipyrimidine photo-lyase [Alteripontixanthobacter muriae]